MKYILIITIIICNLWASNNANKSKGYEAYKKKDYPTALKYFEKGFAEKDSSSASWLSMFYDKGIVVSKDITKSNMYLRKSAEWGNSANQVAMGDLHKFRREYKEALKWYLMAGEQENEIAISALADIYYEQKNYTEASKWILKMAKLGFRNYQNNIANMYTKGEGVSKNYTKAAKWHKLAADQGEAYSQNSLGLLYKYGDGVLQDYTQAEKYFKLAIQQGVNISKCNLGEIYAKQGKKNKAQAIIQEGYNDGIDFCKKVWHRNNLSQ